MSTINPNCDGDYCTRNGEVRVYPLSGGANAILCLICFDKENRYRYNRAKDTGNLQAWPQVNWYTAKVYLRTEGSGPNE